MGEGESEGAVKIFASLIYFNKCLIGFFTKIIFKQISLESSCNISFKNDFDDKITNMFLINFFSFFSKTKIPYQKIKNDGSTTTAYTGQREFAQIRQFT